jgi:glutamate carboxypeptidase
MISLSRCIGVALLVIPLVIPLVTAAPQGGSLDATERTIARTADANNAQALLLLERLVNVNSGTMNFAGVRQVGAMLRAELDALGFATRWVDGASFNRAGHLVAERTGATGAPHILLIGHLDTVFEPSSPFQKFERLSDTTARGPGVIDMKGGDVIIVQAMKVLKAAGVLDRLNLTIVFSGDEEKAGSPVDSARARPARGGKEIPVRHWLRGRFGRSAHGSHRPSQRRRVGGHVHRHTRAFLADLP